MVKEFHYHNMTPEQLKTLSIDEFAKIASSRIRRSLKRGLTEQQKILLENIRKNPGKYHKTHARDMVILPEMIGVKVGIYIGGSKAGDASGKWQMLTIGPQMVGFRLGDFAVSVKRVKHSAPGLGASRGSKHYATKT
ncbi:30S ribosomal protein S19 [archaeon]|nr:MAG: 30S ribosomal protein S19 [archaeon]